MGDSLSREQTFLTWSATTIILCCGARIALCELYMRKLQLVEREKALLDMERRWRGGEQWPQTSKITWLFSKLHSLP